MLMSIQNTADKYNSIATMLDDAGYPKLATYMRQYKDENVIPGCVSAIINKTKPERMETILWQLSEIGAI
jgi:hypothetical protein